MDMGANVHYRNYIVDRTPLDGVSETIRVASDEAAVQTAREIVREKSWNGAEIWDKDADTLVTVIQGGK